MTVDVNAYPVSLAASPGSVTLTATALFAISVVSATPTIASQSVGAGQSRFATPASLSLSPQTVTLTPSIASGSSYTLTVNSATPTVGAQTVEFEEVRQFAAALPTIAGQSVNLGVPGGITATSAAITPSAGSVGLRQAFRVGSVSLSPAMGAIRDDWTLNVGSPPIALTASDVAFVYGTNYTITVDSLARTLWGESVDLILSQATISVMPASPTFSAYGATFGITAAVDAEGIYPIGQNVVLCSAIGITPVGLEPSVQSPRLGITLPVTSASPSIAAQDVTLERSIPGYLGVDSVSLTPDCQVVGLSASSSGYVAKMMFREVQGTTTFKPRLGSTSFRSTQTNTTIKAVT